MLRGLGLAWTIFLRIFSVVFLLRAEGIGDFSFVSSDNNGKGSLDKVIFKTMGFRVNQRESEVC